MASVLKTEEVKASGGSNPSPSAKTARLRVILSGFLFFKLHKCDIQYASHLLDFQLRLWYNQNKKGFYMLTITEIKVHVSTAIESFTAKFPNVELPDGVVIPASRRQAARNKVLHECGTYKEDYYGTRAEVITGPLATKILLYQSLAKTENQVKHALWHEFGHLLFGDENTFGIDLSVDTSLRSGYAIVNEFMAEYVAYHINERESFGDAERPHVYLQMAFQHGTVTPYWLSRYFAIVLGDKNLSEQQFLSAKQYVDEFVWEYIIKTKEALQSQVGQENFWEVDNEFLETIGFLFDELFYYIFMGKLKGFSC